MSFDDSVAIRLESVSKRYRLNSEYGTFKNLLGNWGRSVLRRKRNGHENNFFWALKDIDFEVRKGEALGIIGPNGAGKTTILKLISRITSPTSGNIEMHGRSSSLIELGAGFHPELPGRENIYLNGVILGLTRAQVEERFDQIVAFAELERFIDMPIKRYSSGMYARLGFAVAAHVDPDIMIVDEVLAVGDANFQRKCYDFISNFVKGGKTSVFISHNLYVIEQLCSRVIWLDHGEIMMNDSPSRVLPAYLDWMEQKALSSGTTVKSADRNLKITQVTFTDCQGNEKETFSSGEDIIVTVRYQASQAIDSPHFVIAVSDTQGGPPLFLASMLVDGAAPTLIRGEGMLQCRFKSVPLKPRAYQVWGEVFEADRTRNLVLWQRLGIFRIASDLNFEEQLIGKGGIRHLRADGPVNVQYEWKY